MKMSPNVKLQLNSVMKPVLNYKKDVSDTLVL